MGETSSGQPLGGVEGGEAVVQMYYMREESVIQEQIDKIEKMEKKKKITNQTLHLKRLIKNHTKCSIWRLNKIIKCSKQRYQEKVNKTKSWFLKTLTRKLATPE